MDKKNSGIDKKKLEIVALYHLSDELRDLKHILLNSKISDKISDGTHIHGIFSSIKRKYNEFVEEVERCRDIVSEEINK